MNSELEKILSLITGGMVCIVNGDKKIFASGKEALENLDGKYIIKSINAEDNAVFLVLEKDETVANDMNAHWVKEHIEKYGVEPNLFDGA